MHLKEETWVIVPNFIVMRSKSKCFGENLGLWWCWSVSNEFKRLDIPLLRSFLDAPAMLEIWICSNLEEVVNNIKILISGTASCKASAR